MNVGLQLRGRSMGITFNLQRYSTHDGPGIRTVLFLKGCSLSCRWCQNPEGCRPEVDLSFDARLCLQGCELCTRVSPALQREDQSAELLISRSLLDPALIQASCGVCPSAALRCYGQLQTVADVMTQLRRDVPFYQRSGGGVTLSGGEPFMQPDFSAAILRAARLEGIHTAVESCLHVPWDYLLPSLPNLDLLLADLKHVDGARFKKWTSGSAKRVMDNFRRLKAYELPVIVRVALIPGFNTDEQSIADMLDFVAEETSAHEIHFLPYHTFGMHKYRQLGLEYQASPEPLRDSAIIECAVREAEARGLTAVLRGEA